MRFHNVWVHCLLLCVILVLSACGSELEGGRGEGDGEVGQDVLVEDVFHGVSDTELTDVRSEHGADVAQDIEDSGGEPEDVGRVQDADDEDVDGGGVEEPVEGDDDDDYILPAGTRFVWPAPAWITSTDYYPTGKEHSGSADLALPYWTDVGASRGGKVVRSTWTKVGGYLVSIDHGGGYKTLYSHLSAPPLVSVGDQVVTGQLLGFAGRTGNAFNGGCHVHFSITKDGNRLVIPGIAYGDWVDRGEAIAGHYTGLSELSEAGERFFDVRVHENVGIRKEAKGGSEVISNAKKGEVLTVTGSDSGYYRVRHQGKRGFVVHTATRPVMSEISSIEITAQNANVRRGPDTQSEVVGTIANGKIVTVFETRGNWKKLLFKLPTEYAWTHTSNTKPTGEFFAKIRSKNANVRSGAGVEHGSVGLLSFNTEIHVLEVKQGWYRIKYEGKNAWVAGWLTQGQF